MTNLDRGAIADAASPSGHPSYVPLNPKQIEMRFDSMFRAAGSYAAKGGAYLWRTRALTQWRLYSERLLAGAG